MVRVTTPVRWVMPPGLRQSKKFGAGLTETIETDRPRNSPAVTAPVAVAIN